MVLPAGLLTSSSSVSPSSTSNYHAHSSNFPMRARSPHGKYRGPQGKFLKGPKSQFSALPTSHSFNTLHVLKNSSNTVTIHLLKTITVIHYLSDVTLINYDFHIDYISSEMFRHWTFYLTLQEVWYFCFNSEQISDDAHLEQTLKFVLIYIGLELTRLFQNIILDIQ